MEAFGVILEFACKKSTRRPHHSGLFCLLDAFAGVDSDIVRKGEEERVRDRGVRERCRELQREEEEEDVVDVF